MRSNSCSSYWSRADAFSYSAAAGNRCATSESPSVSHRILLIIYIYIREVAIYCLVPRLRLLPALLFLATLGPHIGHAYISSCDMRLDVFNEFKPCIEIKNRGN